MRKHSINSTLPPPPPPTTPKTGSKMKVGIIVTALIAIILVAVVALFFFNVIPWPFKSNVSGGPVNYGVLIGKITDIFGFPLSNVTVSVGGQTGKSNDQGWYSVANVTPGNKQLVTFTMNGSATTYQTTDIQLGNSSFVEATMSPVDKTSSFDASTGATITTTDGGSVEIGNSSLVTSQGTPYTGTATIFITTFDPSDENEASAFPGEYLGISAQDQTTGPIKSYGFMDVYITTQDGEKLNLDTGKNATIKIPVPAIMQTEAAALPSGRCPLWYFDTAIGTWREEGYGIYDNSIGCFVGNVTHFSTWNYDIRYPAGYVSGRVVDSNGNPVQGAQVKCWGTGWYMQRWASGETMTGANGNFTRIPVEVGVIFKYQASKNGHKSAVLQIPHALAQNEAYDVGDIVLDAPIVQITVTWGENPRDLDSHLTARLTGNTTFHVYYSAKGSLGADPYANLDTDDTNGFGPEVTSISRLRQGTYRFSVRHFAGEGNISTSGIEVNVVIPNVGIYRFTAPSGQTADTDIWRILDMTVDSNGRVTGVNTINDYVQGGDQSDLLFPP